MRTYAPAPSIPAPSLPFYQLGENFGKVRSLRGMAEARAPKLPLYQLGLGASGTSQAITAAGAIGSKFAGSAVTSAATTAGWGSVAGPIGAGVAVAIGVIVGLIAAHAQRVKDAKNENAAAAAAISGFYSIIQQIVSAYNNGQLAASDAIAQLQSLDQATYQALRSHVGTPGTAWNSNTPGVCDKSCTVGCCLYNTWLHRDIYGGNPSMPKHLGVIPVLQAGGGTTVLASIPSNKYGFPAMPAITLTVNPPARASSLSTSAADVVSSVESALTGGTSAPSGTSSGGGGSIIPLLLLAGGALLLLR